MATTTYSVDLKVRATQGEAEVIRRHAQQAGLSVSRYLATLGAGHELRTQYDQEALAALLYQVKRIGQNVNQLTRAMHTGHVVGAEDIKAARTAVEQTSRAVVQALKAKRGRSR